MGGRRDFERVSGLKGGSGGKVVVEGNFQVNDNG